MNMTMRRALSTDTRQQHFYEIVNRFEDLYIMNRDRYIIAQDGRMYMPKDGDKNKKLTNKDVILHLTHHFAIGVYCPSIGSKFLCFDVDLPDPSIVFKIISSLEEFGIPRDKVYVSSSGGKGYHVEIFFTDIVYGNMLRDLYDWVVAKEGLDPKKVEFRPTDKQAIKLPLSVHHKTGKICWYADTTQPPSLPLIEDMGYVMKIERIDRDEFEKMCMEKAEQMKEMEKEGAVKDIKEEKEEGGGGKAKNVPAASMMTGPGMRHSMMLQIARTLRAKNVPQEEIAAQLLSWAKWQNPAYITDTWQVVEEDAASLASWVWSDKYTVPVLKEVFLTKEDLARILSVPRAAKAQRRILLLIALFTKKYGKMKMSSARIGEYAGVTNIAATSALNALVDAGLVAKKPGKKVRTESGDFKSVSNTYIYVQPPREEEEDEKIIRATWDFSSPPEMFNNYYLSLLRDNTSREEWPTLFTKAEIKELLRLEDEFERKDSL